MAYEAEREMLNHFYHGELTERAERVRARVYAHMDAFAEYCETSGLMDNEDEEAEIDIEEAAIFMAKQA